MYRGLRAAVSWCVHHRVDGGAATVGVFVARDRRLRPRAAAVLPDVGAHRAVRAAAHAGRHRHRRHAGQRPRGRERCSPATRTPRPGRPMSGRARRASGSASTRRCPTRPMPRSSSSPRTSRRASGSRRRSRRRSPKAQLAEARVRVDRFNFGPPVGFPVQFRVIGTDPNTVRAIAYQVRDVMRAESRHASSRSSTGTSRCRPSGWCSTRTAPARSVSTRRPSRRRCRR